MYFVVHLTTQKERQTILSKFDAINSDHDGRITKSKLKERVKSLGLNYSDQEIDEIFVKAGRDGGDDISYTDFAIVMVDYQKLHQADNIIAVFKQFDKTSSGKISIEEFRCIFQNHGQILGDDMESQWKEIDLDGDGFFDFIEFKVFVINIAERMDAQIK